MSEFKILNEEEIKARRVPIEEVELSLGKSQKWICHYCEKGFSSETMYMRHSCREKEKSMTLASPLGQAAYIHYCDWMRMQKYSQPSTQAFLSSKYFSSFVKFAELVKTAGISKSERYIQLMIDSQVLPPLWHRAQCYSLYVEYMDKLVPPDQQVLDSINELTRIAEIKEIDVAHVFSSLTPNEVFDLFRKRKLSPWYAFLSKNFANRLKEFSKEDRKILEIIINKEYWVSTFNNNPEMVVELKNLIADLGI